MLQSVIEKYGGYEVQAMDVYRDMFKLGEHYIQEENEPAGSFKANPLGYMKQNGAVKGKYRILFEDSFEQVLNELQQSDFAILNGISYYGRKNTQENASKMYALIIDVDGVTDQGLSNFFYGAYSEEYLIYPVPNYVILSGHGVHLYYIFEEPVSLYPNIKLQLKELKYALTRKIWNRNVTDLYEHVQYQGLNQGFRVIGGKSKIDGVTVRAYKMHDHPYSINQLNEYIPEESQVDSTKLWKESRMTLAEARKKFPDWYERIVLQKQECGTWTCKPDLYYWWLRELKSGAAYGHRYFCIMCLAIYAIKSGIEYDQLEQDAMGLIRFLNGLNEDEPFTESDVRSALECFDRKYKTFPIDDIVKLTAIQIQKNKRNGRKQALHLKIARSTLAIMNEEIGRSLQGRPSAEMVVAEWVQLHPDGRKAECIRDTGLSKKTVYKWFDRDAL